MCSESQSPYRAGSSSNLKKEMTKILKEKGYILDYKFDEDDKQGLIKIALKYHPVTEGSCHPQPYTYF